jgi:hypothetical protein
MPRPAEIVGSALASTTGRSQPGGDDRKEKKAKVETKT